MQRLRMTIKTNLFLILELENLQFKGARIISYETEVGHIKDNTIFVNGSYSRTTGKHISALRQITGFKVVKENKKPFFYWFGYGEKISFPESLSSGLSFQLLKSLSSGLTPILCIAKADIKGRRDKSLIEDFLDSNGVEKDFIEKTRERMNKFSLDLFPK
jgi:hypothetical protein